MEKSGASSTHHHTKHVHKKSKAGLLDRIFMLVIIVSVIYIAYLFFQDEILAILQMNPYVWAVVSHIFEEISERTLAGLFYAAFFGSLFFIFIPLEALFLYYISLQLPMPLIITLTMIGVIMGLSLDYLFGFIVGARVVKAVIGDNFDKFHKKIKKWGGVIVFFGNVIVFPIQPVSVVIGTAKYSYKKFVILTAAGLFVKLIGLIFLSSYLKQNFPGFF